MAIMDTIKKMIVPDIDEQEEEAQVEERPAATRRNTREIEENANGLRRAKVVNINHGAASRIVIAKLDSAAGVKPIINHLKEKTPVVFSIARLDRNDAARVVDVIYGASFAVDGGMQKVSNDIFVVTPHGIEITGDVATELMGSEDFSLDI